MAINYAIQAQVIDIRHDSPNSDDIFLVDTNVWYWMFYFRATQADQPPRHYQTTNYPAYINKVRAAGGLLVYCGLSLSELAHLIEKTEYEIFKRANGYPQNTKEFRHNYTNKRQKVVQRIRAVWQQVNNIALPIDVQIDALTTDRALRNFDNYALDGYDLFFIEAINKAGAIKVITDDGDYVTIAGIQVFTANFQAIASATSQGKLLSR